MSRSAAVPEGFVDVGTGLARGVRAVPVPLPTPAPPWKRGQAVGNGLKAHHFFGRLRDRPKPAGFGESGAACWMAGRSAVG